MIVLSLLYQSICAQEQLKQKQHLLAVIKGSIGADYPLIEVEQLATLIALFLRRTQVGCITIKIIKKELVGSIPLIGSLKMTHHLEKTFPFLAQSFLRRVYTSTIATFHFGYYRGKQRLVSPYISQRQIE